MDSFLSLSLNLISTDDDIPINYSAGSKSCVVQSYAFHLTGFGVPQLEGKLELCLLLQGFKHPYKGLIRRPLNCTKKGKKKKKKIPMGVISHHRIF